MRKIENFYVVQKRSICNEYNNTIIIIQNFINQFQKIQ